MAKPVTVTTILGAAGNTDSVAVLDTNYGNIVTAINDGSNGWFNLVSDTGVANAYVVTLPSGAIPSAYQKGFVIAVLVANTNTGISTINANTLGLVNIVNPANLPLNGGEMPKNAITVLAFDGTSFRIVGPCALSSNTISSSTTLTINCAGYTSVSAVVNFTGAGITITLSNLAQGVPVSLGVLNTSGTAHGINLAATNPAGTAFTFIGAYPSGSVNGVGGINMLTTGVTLNNNFQMMFTGSAFAPLQMNLAT